jgi:hypothetical protein
MPVQTVQTVKTVQTVQICQKKCFTIIFQIKTNLVREVNVSALDKSVCGRVVAVVGKEVVVQLPKHMQSDAAWNLSRLSINREQRNTSRHFSTIKHPL